MALVKSAEEIQLMRRAGAILADVLARLARSAVPGISTKELDAEAEQLIRASGGEPAFLGYRPDGASRPFPATLCASLNDVVVHGVPSRYILLRGDVLKLDLGVKFRGYYADAAITIPVGKVSEEAAKLIEATQRALDAAIQVVRPERTLGDIGHAIQTTVSRAGFHVVQGLTGHFIGNHLHEDPSVLNEGRPGKGLKLLPGMVLAIEPMVSAGSPHIIQQEDEGYRIVDGSLSAHSEHTVLVTESGAEVLTK